jgi:predicted nuclease of predicted toxin-antitoxin system
VRVLIDMNLSPQWVEVFRKAGVHAVHWAEAGQPNAPDTEIMQYAAEHGVRELYP